MSLANICVCCQEELFRDSQKYQPTFEGWDPEKFHALTRLLDRGTQDGGEEGLCYPSPTLCHITRFALSVWDSLINHKKRRKKFLGCDNHKDTFLKILVGLAREYPEFEAAQCCNGHNMITKILPIVGSSLFNGFGSNLCRDINSTVHAKLPSKRQATGDYERATRSHDKLKLQKLQGQKK